MTASEAKQMLSRLELINNYENNMKMIVSSLKEMRAKKYEDGAEMTADLDSLYATVSDLYMKVICDRVNQSDLIVEKLSSKS